MLITQKWPSEAFQKLLTFDYLELLQRIFRSLFQLFTLRRNLLFNSVLRLRYSRLNFKSFIIDITFFILKMLFISKNVKLVNSLF